MSSVNMSVDLNGLKLKNPITVASGTFGFGREYANYVDLNDIGAISVKGLTLEPRQGNEGIRIAETPMGMINSVGLQNPGVEVFIKEEIPFLRQFDTKIIANINGNNIEEYCKMAEILSYEDVDSLELNISCPNVKNGGLAFGTNPSVVKEVVSKVRKASRKHLIVKLSPNVTNIKEIAMIAEQEGADCISLINTLSGMVIDINKRKPVLMRGSGGLSGPAIKPVAVRMVYDVYDAVKIPILGMGGISNSMDAIEFFLAGANAIAIGTANFVNPKITKQVLEGIEVYLAEHKYNSINELVRDLNV
ncbi:dihydroorotate dehydrogenase [Fusibacter ferrireducens]|uniref:Dihydroorotate dehydrogenase n=1 Tax=Fusibacter ferrireducens TaxID=2785058 RepID=A0ABR9ZZB5_9FIRM|nr:dihydroorotate dehydrogenase [Fusibacter ferrireducens]MBF4695798.1 dihydroorotate dehydrogenase [Fusibacter ferrireducens]